MASPIRITLFGGIIPRLSDRGLPDNAAQFALNAKLYSGELRAWNLMRPLDTLSIPNAATVYHYQHVGVDHRGFARTQDPFGHGRRGEHPIDSPKRAPI